MTIKNMLARLTAILTDDRHVEIEKYKSLQKILKALKHERNSLEESLSETDDIEQKQAIRARLNIVSAQRKKGIDVLKNLKKTGERS